jgi:hypothetical protein
MEKRLMKVFSLLLAALATLCLSTLAFATDDGNFSIGIVTGLPATDTFINLSNSGASDSYPYLSYGGVQYVGNGNICANVYVFSADEQEQACCACFLTPNAIASYSVINELISNPLTGSPYTHTGAVIKILATSAPGTTCDPANVEQTVKFGAPAPNTQWRAPGLLAWGRLGGDANVPFISSSLSASELQTLTSQCAFIEKNGSRHGVCGPCQPDAE